MNVFFKRILPLAVLFLGLTFGLIMIALPLDRGPFGGGVQSTEARFWDSANRIHKNGLGAWKQDGTNAPLYSLALSPVIKPGLSSTRDARRTLLWVTLPLFAVLVTALAWRSFPGWPAALAGVATVFVAPVLIDAGTFTPAVPAAALALLVLYVVSFRGGTVLWVLAGVLLALVIRFLPLLGWILAFLLLIGLLLHREPGTRWRGAGFALAFLVTTAGLGATGRMGAALPSTLGVDVYRGHRVPASGVHPRRGDRDDRRWWAPLDYLRESSRLANRRQSTAEVSLYWTERALLESVTHPLQELRRDGIKLLATFQGDPTPRAVSAAFLIDRAENPWPLRIAIWMGRVLVPLGLVGLVAGLWVVLRSGGEGRRGLLMLVLGALAGWLAGSVTFVDADYRLLTVLCCLGGLAPLFALLFGARALNRRFWSAAALGAVLVFGFLPAWGTVPGLGILGADYLELGALYDREGRGSAAMREYERTTHLDPTDPYPHLGLAGMLARDNVLDQATAELEHLRENHPDFVPGLNGLASLYQGQKRWTEAAAVYAQLSRLEPWNPEHLNDLGTMYVQLGLYDQATRALEAALTLDPSYKLASDNLESLRVQGLAPGAPAGADSLRIAQEAILARMRSGDYSGARTDLNAAYARYGHDRSELQFIEGTLYLVTGDPAHAIPLLEFSAKHMPSSVPVLANLGTAYAEAGRFADAERVFNDALRLQPSNFQVQKSLAGVRASADSLRRSGH